MTQRNEYEPPHIDPDKLDFSQFHPLDHWPLSKRCREHYGGFRNHVKLVWCYKWNIEGWIKEHITHCPWGRHCYRPWFRAAGGIPGGEMKYAGRTCIWCHDDMPESLPG